VKEQEQEHQAGGRIVLKLLPIIDVRARLIGVSEKGIE